jgi:hypothetical protein
MDGDTTAPEPTPHLRVVRGEPTAEELAALVTVLAAAAGRSDGPVDDEPTSAWNDRLAWARPPLRPGPGAWRSSAWRR